MARREQGPTVVRFYQLAATPMEEAVLRIVAKAHERGMRLCLVVEDEAEGRRLDDRLWRHPVDGFLPHGLSQGPDAERQPVLICLQPEERNGATVAVMATARPVDSPDRFDLIIDFTDDREGAAKTAARQRYRFYQSRGCRMEYWIQSAQGWQIKENSASPPAGG